MANARRGKARRWATVAMTVLVLGGGAGVWVATRPSPPMYRLALAGPADVSSALSTTGTVQSVNQATLSFPVSGQVAAVNVQVGQSVTAGEVVATQDTTNLTTQLASAQSRVASAEAKLATDQNSQTAVATKPTTQQPENTGKTGSETTAKPVAPPPALASGQDAVKKAQQQVDGDLAMAASAVSQEKTACAEAAESTNSTSPTTTQSSPPATSGSSTPTSSAAPPASSSSSGSTSGTEISRCTTLIQHALDDQSRVSADERALADAEAGLTTTLNQAIAGENRAASATPPGATTHGSTPGVAADGRDRAQAPASADQLAADQASVDAANADLGVAQQNANAATLISPITGTVARVGITPGQSVPGASTQNTIVIIGPGSDQITTTVSDTQVGQVRPGQDAIITPDGAGQHVTGKVISVAILPSTTSSGTAGYPVTIALDPTSQPLFAGATAAVSISLGSTHASVTVPTSAVRTMGSQHLVSVLRNGELTTVPVTLGVAGATLTEVASGVRPGDQVVLADLATPLPTTNTTQRGFGGPGGFGGGGGRGGGPGG
jgi:multidrug efflux pump subunit AcrA (membrane-fusion protein)